MSHCRHGLAVTVRLPWRASFWNGIAGQAERHVECDATDDVGADAQPIRGQVRVADPCLIRFSLEIVLTQDPGTLDSGMLQVNQVTLG